VLHDVGRLLDIRGIVRIYDYYRRPIVWFLMDEKPYTGGCQYAWSVRLHETVRMLSHPAL
jgi:hypothetical protein